MSSRKPARLPNHAQLSDFISSILPPDPADVAFQYHVPRFQAGYDPSQSLVGHVVLSVTPTRGVYREMRSTVTRFKPVAFIHRPFWLERRNLPRNVLVLASHKRFDERLTVGFNEALLGELGLGGGEGNGERVVLKGYKDDAERLMGVIAPVRQPVKLHSVLELIKKQFGVCETHAAGADQNTEIKAVAIVNAFNPGMISRVAEAAVYRSWSSTREDMHSVLYLTGQARDTGLIAAHDVNMPVACVGHRAAEEWGIRYLARRLREQFPGLRTSEIYEDEEPPPPRGPAKQYGCQVNPLGKDSENRNEDVHSEQAE